MKVGQQVKFNRVVVSSGVVVDVEGSDRVKIRFDDLDDQGNELIISESVESIMQISLTPQQMSDPEYRRAFYSKYGFTAQSIEERDWLTRLAAYQSRGFTAEAFDDRNQHVRLAAYQTLGFNEKATTDNDPVIRLLGYLILGFTQDALVDSNSDISSLAKKFFEI